MNPLQERYLPSLSVAKLACAVLIGVAVLVAAGCSHKKPQTATKPVVLKVNKHRHQSETSGESDIDYGGPAVSRHNLALAGTKWEWEGDLGPGRFDGPTPVAEYSLAFKPNGWFDFRADCRHGAGIYEVKEQHISMAVINASRAVCQPGSRADDFLHGLEAARTFRTDQSKLYFDLNRESKIMVFGLKP